VTVDADASTSAPPDPADGGADGPTSTVVTAVNVRGSLMMLVGQVSAMAVNFAAQLLVVRHLTKAEYGAFAWALSGVLLLQSVVALGLDRADTRFMAHYDERHEYGRLRGLLVVEASTVVIFGLTVLGVALVAQGPIGDTVAPSGSATTLLLILLALAPLQALDSLVVNVFAVFATPRSVFFRRYVLEPGLRLLVVATLVATDGSARYLAAGYLLAGAVGLGIYVVLLVRLLDRTGLARRFATATRELPVRELFAFSLPMLLTNLVAVATTELAAVLLGRYRAATDVASFRAVQPFAALNLVVLFSFMILFTPVAARAIARSDIGVLRDLYWRTCGWITVLTAPVFLLTTVFARPLVATTLGAKYASSAPYLSMLALGYFVNAALGFNGLVVQMLGRVRFVLVTNVAVLSFMVVADVVLIPPLGAAGAAVAVLATLLVHNAWKQGGLVGGVGVWDGGHARTCLGVAAAVAILGAIEAVAQPPLLVALALCGVAGVVLLRVNRRRLSVADTFPEAARLPVVARVLR